MKQSFIWLLVATMAFVIGLRFGRKESVAPPSVADVAKNETPGAQTTTLPAVQVEQQHAATPLQSDTRGLSMAARVHSRDTALAYLQKLLDSSPVESMRSKDVPKITFLTEDDLSPDERARFADVREMATKRGRTLVFTRVDGVDGIHVHEMEPIADSFIPNEVRIFLTEEDLRAFRYKMMFLMIELNTIRFNHEP
jgi:hypothetical protein